MEKSRLKFKGRIIQDEFVPDQPTAYLNHKRSFGTGDVSVIMDKWTKYKERSNQQNRYWHAVICQMLSDENGDSPFYWHKYLKIKFLLKRMIGREPDMDKIIKAGKFDEIADMLTTTSLSTKEFNLIQSEVRMWASEEFQCYIPEPNETPVEF